MKFFYFLILISSISCGTHASLQFTIQDAVLSIGQTVEGLVVNVTTAFQPDYLFKFIQNVVQGLPTQIVSTPANALCSFVVSLNKDPTPDEFEPKLENVKLQFRTACDKRTYGIDNLTELANDPEFDVKRRTVIYSSGWMTTVNNEHNDALGKAYNCRGDTNYLALDVGDYINTYIVWSARNTVTIGKYLAVLIERLSTIIDLKDLHIMGHSLGAQIMGYAARYYRNTTGNYLPYVTGLDPAFPCFNQYANLTTLSASDAEFVDIIHTNPGLSGHPEPNGDVDFYVGGKFPIQNACDDAECSHEIAVAYYTESVYPNNERDFLAKRCDSLLSLEQGKCNGEEYPMGYAVPHNLKGNFILDANSQKPYGRNATADYTDPDTTSCGSCPSN